MSVDSFHTSGHSPGPEFDKPTAVFPTVSRCRVGLLGFGTVGSAVARRLASHAVRGLDLTHIFDRRAHRKRNRLSSGGAGRIVWTDRIDDVLTSDIDVVVEATGGVEPAAGWIRAALLAGCAMEQAVADARAWAYAELDPSDDSTASTPRRSWPSFARSVLACGSTPLRSRRDRPRGLRPPISTTSDAGAAPSASSRMPSTTICDRPSRRRSRRRPYRGHRYSRTSPACRTPRLSRPSTPATSVSSAPGDATAVGVMSDLVAIARDRAAIVPAAILSAPRAIVGLEPA